MFEFECGCKFPIIEKTPEFIRIEFDADIENINQDCPKVWELMDVGNTKGVFQQESPFARQITKRLKPRSIEQIAALSALLRPGCSAAIVDGKSLTDHYLDRKSGADPVVYYHPALEDILNKTYGILVYQEQSMSIAVKIAGFDKQQADVLRKSIGKKSVSLMMQVEKEFVEGAVKTGVVTKEEAVEIFRWIRESANYSFNKSHAVSYAQTGYMTAYLKTHFKKAFFTEWMACAHMKICPNLEMSDLINNARTMNVDIYPPDIRRFNKEFNIYDGKVYYGLTDIRGIGSSMVDKTERIIKAKCEQLSVNLDDFTWEKFLVYITPDLGKAVVEGLIKAGALSYMKKSRKYMLYQYNLFSTLSEREVQYIIDHYEGLIETIRKGIELGSGRDKMASNKNRLEKIRGVLNSLIEPSYSLDDTAEFLAETDKHYLGYSLTCSKVDGYTLKVDTKTCEEAKESGGLIAVEITALKETTVKNGQSKGRGMGFITVADSTGSLDIVAFSDIWEEESALLSEGNVVLMEVQLGKNDSFILKRVKQL